MIGECLAAAFAAAGKKQATIKIDSPSLAFFRGNRGLAQRLITRVGRSGPQSGAVIIAKPHAIRQHVAG